MNTARPRRGRGDTGSVMPMAVVIITFLLIAMFSLVSASQADWSLGAWRKRQPLVQPLDVRLLQYGYSTRFVQALLLSLAQLVVQRPRALE